MAGITVPMGESTLVLTPIPKFVEGGWLIYRDKTNNYTMEKPFENTILHTAFGMQAVIRIKMENVPENFKKVKVSVFEKDLLFDDDIERAQGIEAIRVKRENSYAIFEAELLIGEKDFWETTGKETLSEFYFNGYHTDSEGNIIEQKKMPEDENKFLRVAAPSTINEQVLAVAKLYGKDEGTGGVYSNTGGFSVTRYGMPETVIFKNDSGSTKKWDMKSITTTYCCGFTFWVALRVLQSNRMIDKKTPTQMENFRKHFWGNMGVDSNGNNKMCAAAIPYLGVGKEITFTDCIAGDFVQIGRVNYSGVFSASNGHSVIFLSWIMKNNKKIGFKYRSSQGAGLHP